jgi:hypothetical protein
LKGIVMGKKEMFTDTLLSKSNHCLIEYIFFNGGKWS